MRLPKLTDRFSIEMEGVTIVVAPLSGRDKITLASFTSWEKGKIKVDRPSQELFIVKKTVKEVHGITNMDGTPYELKFEHGELTEDCADEVLAFLAGTWFTTAFDQISSEDGSIVSPLNGKVIEGVKVKHLIPEKKEEVEGEKK